MSPHRDATLRSAAGPAVYPKLSDTTITFRSVDLVPVDPSSDHDARQSDRDPSTSPPLPPALGVAVRPSICSARRCVSRCSVGVACAENAHSVNQTNGLHATTRDPTVKPEFWGEPRASSSVCNTRRTIAVNRPSSPVRSTRAGTSDKMFA
jgi:hypothetical protein